jgi:cytochrome c biogenesis protein CcmG, thiol:disulfide interchange protein DsbE
MRRLGARGAVIGVPLAALLALLGFGVLHGARSRGIDDALAAGKRPPAPELELPRLGSLGRDGLAGRRGEVVVVNFWASWCAPCRDETPLLERWQRRLAPRHATVLGVDVLDVESDALRFARRLGVTYPLLRDRDAAVARSFGVAGYPETVVIDRQGRIAALARGPVDAAFMRTRVLPLLAERA